MVFHEACDRLQRIDERLFYSNLEGFLIYLRIFKKSVINYVRFMLYYISLKVVPIILYTIYVWFILNNHSLRTIYTFYIFNTILNNRLVDVYLYEYCYIIFKCN